MKKKKTERKEVKTKKKRKTYLKTITPFPFVGTNYNINFVNEDLKTSFILYNRAREHIKSRRSKKEKSSTCKFQNKSTDFRFYCCSYHKFGVCIRNMYVSSTQYTGREKTIT